MVLGDIDARLRARRLYLYNNILSAPQSLKQDNSFLSCRTRPDLKKKKKMSVEENNLIEILEEDHKVDIAKYMDYVSDPLAGAVATFSGTTRDTFQGKTVLELRYEAYVPMASRCISSICATARSTWNLHKIAFAHRLGPVPVGESSVFIAVSAVHRADALDACKFLIDELKASVPIWKKEVYTNGEVWKENSEFMERRLELAEEGGGAAKKPVVEGHRRRCCGTKVRVEDEEQKDVAEEKISSS